MRSLVVSATVLFIPFALAWKCISLQSKTLHDGVIWNTQNCTMDEDAEPHLTVNSIHIDISRQDLRVIPAIADPVAQVQTIPDMAKQNSNFLAGINGGYFWRVDIDGFWRDNVCRGKVRKEAEQPASPLHVNFGIGDGTVKIDGTTYSHNCNCTGYSRPAVLKLASTESSIEVLHRGEQVDARVRSAIGAGPNLVSYNITTSASYVDIPADDDNVNRLVYEATTAVGLSRYDVQGSAQTVPSDSDSMGHTLIMVTTDGSDSCMPKDDYCGLVAPNLASLMLEVFNCTQAMSMDQGGSTTMWISGENPDRDGVVSRSDNKKPAEEEGARPLANGLFVELLSA